MTQINQDWGFSALARCDETWAGTRELHVHVHGPNWCWSERFSPWELLLSLRHFLSSTVPIYPLVRVCVCVNLLKQARNHNYHKRNVFSRYVSVSEDLQSYFLPFLTYFDTAGPLLFNALLDCDL